MQLRVFLHGSGSCSCSILPGLGQSISTHAPGPGSLPGHRRAEQQYIKFCIFRIAPHSTCTLPVLSSKFNDQGARLHQEPPFKGRLYGPASAAGRGLILPEQMTYVLQADGEGWAPTPQKLASATVSGATSAAPAVPHRAPQAALTDGVPKAGTKTRSLNELVNHLSRDEQEASRHALTRTPSPLPGQHSQCLNCSSSVLQPACTVQSSAKPADAMPGF